MAGSKAFTALTQSATGRITPVSLFTSIMDTRAVSGRRAAASCPAPMRPARSGFKYVTSYPCRSRSLQVSSTAACSIAVVTMCFPRRRFSSIPRRSAQLSLSVPQEVKNNSAGEQPTAAATVSRPSFTRWAACRAYPYREEGLPNCPRASTMASTASGRTGVVAA